jgi:hypothetical protein
MDRPLKLPATFAAQRPMRGGWPGPPDKAIVFSLRIEQAVFIEWDIGHGLMTVHRWSPGSEYGGGQPRLSLTDPP